jgi:hypothetical protein
MSVTALTAAKIRLLDEYDPALKEAGISTILSAIITKSNATAALLAASTNDADIITNAADIANAITLVNDIRISLKGDYLISKPGLVIGSSAATAIKNGSAFDYIINGVQYNAASAETAFAGTEADLPSAGAVYGAWRLIIDAAGTMSIQEAADNATGYATAELALADLPALTADNAAVGTLTVLAADGTAFDPATTELSAANITDAYADGGTAFEAIGAAVS